MQPEILKQSLNAIKEYVSGIHELKEDNEIRLMRLQLRMIDKSIRQFEKAGIQVPEGVTSDRDTLEAKLKEIKSGPHGLATVYDELMEILIQIGGVLTRRPDRDIYRKMKEQRRKEISSRSSNLAATPQMPLCLLYTSGAWKSQVNFTDHSAR